MQWRAVPFGIGTGRRGHVPHRRSLDYHTLLDQAPLLAISIPAIVALLVVLAIGHSRFGARRWVSLGGGVNLQVSEIMKLVIIIVLARFFSEVRTDRLTLADLVKIAGITGLPVLLVLVQPDSGTAMVLVPAAIVGAFLAGIQWKHLAVLLAFIVLMIPVGWKMRTHLKPYQQQRIATFIHPEDNPRGAGYQILQSEIAVGSGGFWGQGLRQGQPESIGLRARPLFGFHSGRDGGRRTGICRSASRFVVVFGIAPAPHRQRAKGERSRRNVCRDGRGGHPGISRAG